MPLTFKRGQSAQIQQAFKNIEVALKDAGGSGWDQVFKVRQDLPQCHTFAFLCVFPFRW
jgi:enamine deaminase RidA (YjgF/YER057c/UK114 family)